VPLFGFLTCLWLCATLFLVFVKDLNSHVGGIDELDGRKRVRARGMIHLDYVNLTGEFTDHPHMLALDENGSSGYIHDASALHRNPPRFALDNSVTRSCEHNDATMQLLTDRVFVDFQAHELAEQLSSDKNIPRVKIFCHVYTTSKSYSLIQTIRQTWGHRCDGFLAASTVTDRSVDAVNIPHEGKESYSNMWQKSRSMWSYVYDHYYHEFDWFHIGGDDMYVIVENLRLYLESKEIVHPSYGGDQNTLNQQHPLILGTLFHRYGNEREMYVIGGGGYTLNKAALKVLVMSFRTCAVHNLTSAEDYMVTYCLKKRGIRPFNTKDATGAERYVHVHPEFLFNFDPRKNPLFWYSYFSTNINVGPERVVNRPVSFHLKRGDVEGNPTVQYSMMRIHAILYRYCENITRGPPVPTKRWKNGEIMWKYWKSPRQTCLMKAKGVGVCSCSKVKGKTVCNIHEAHRGLIQNEA